MSSPLQSLKKGPKSRMFVGTGLSLDSLDQRPIPFRSKPNYSDDESKLLDDITSNMATSRIKSHQPTIPVSNISHQTTGNTGPSPLPGGTGLPKISRTGQKTNNHTTAPNDKDLMSLMMNKITLLEQRVQYQNKDIQEKDKRIHILEDKLKILKKANDSSQPSHVKELEKKCLLLQQQIHEMETFLSDYGMVWLGDRSLDESDVYLDEDEDVDERIEESTSDEGAVLWRPGSSVSSVRPFHVNFDQLIENIKDLNVLAGEGVAKVTKTTDGARLKIPEAVPLALYSNGIALYSGPFRPYSDPSTQQCIQDLLDGYFPSELQQRYPDGIPFIVSDKRNVKFVDKRQQKIFHGAGQVLGGEKKPSRLIPSYLNKPSNRDNKVGVSQTSSDVCMTEPVSETSNLPGPKLRVDDLLNNLPKSVVRGGKVIDIRESIGQHIKGDKTGENEVSVVETDVSVEWKKRVEEKNVDSRPVTPRNVTTLRIKSECGNETYIVKMKFTETIGDLKNYLQKHRNVDASRISIMSTYPSRSYDDNTETLQDCGLTPNAVLHLRLTKK